jgi:hypothetical protein
VTAEQTTPLARWEDIMAELTDDQIDAILVRGEAARLAERWAAGARDDRQLNHVIGAEFTKAWSNQQGSPEASAAGARPPEELPTSPRPPHRRRQPEPDDKPTTAAATTHLPVLRLAAFGTVVLAALRGRR